MCARGGEEGEEGQGPRVGTPARARATAEAPPPPRAPGNTCILVGFHDDKIQPGAARSTVGKLADFLKESNI